MTYDLTRFVEARDSGGTYAQALTELHQGSKVSHWMWFVFPQVAGLGRSVTARHYAIGSLEEAWAYSAHPEEPTYSAVLTAHFGGEPHQRTLSILP